MKVKSNLVVVSVGEKTSKKGNLYFPVVAVQDGETVNLYTDNPKIKGVKLYEPTELTLEIRSYKGQLQTPTIVL